MLVEPWFPPGFLEHGREVTNEATAGDVRIVRRCRVELADRVSRLHFDYEITDSGTMRQATEVHELGLFTVDEMCAAFARAGLRARYSARGLCDRGLLIALEQEDQLSSGGSEDPPMRS